MVEKINYRLEALKEEAEEIAKNLREIGLMNADLEVIGALLFTKYKGSDAKLSELFESSQKLIEEAEVFLTKLRSK